MKRRKYLWVVFAAVLFFFACSRSDNDAEAGCVGKPVQKVLFIGNSYTAANNLPHLVKGIACSGGYKIEVATTTPGGYKFYQHAANRNTLKLIASQKWDFVILQNQSQIPGLKPRTVRSRSTPHAKTLVKAIKANNRKTKIIYYVTWGRRNGDTRNCKYYRKVCTFEGHTQALLAGYTLYRNATGGTLAKVGSAWKAVVDDRKAPFPAGDLWVGDHSHPTLKGTYLAACTLFAAMFDQSLADSYYPKQLSKKDATYLQGIATAVMIKR